MTIPAELTIPCPACGYDLRAARSDRCPECGTRIDRSVTSQIPWCHRHILGAARAYARTVWLATLRARELAREIERPVSYSDARRFQLVTVIIAWIPIALLIGVADFRSRNLPAAIFVIPGVQPISGWAIDLLLPWLQAARLQVPLPLGALAFLLLVSGVGSYLFHPRNIEVERQNRAVALSIYACAPLAFAFAPIAVLGAAATLGAAVELSWPVIIAIGAVVFLLAGFIAWSMEASTLALLRGVRRSRLLAAFLLPLLWLASAMIGLFVVPWVIGFVALVFFSFR